MRRLTIWVPAADVDGAYGKIRRKLHAQSSLPGFRPGKMPSALFDRHFGAKIELEASEGIMDDAWQKAQTQLDIRPVAQAQLVRRDTVRRGTDFSFILDVEICPKGVLKHMEGLAVATPPSPQVTEADVDAAVEAVRQDEAQTVPVIGRDVATKGDIVLIDFETTLDGEPLPDGSGRNVLVHLGHSEYVAGFAEAIEGATVPGACEATLTMPDNYEPARLAGKSLHFVITCKELKHKELPDLNDALAQDVGDASLEAMRTRLHDTLWRTRQTSHRRAAHTEAMAALVAANPFEVPPSLVDRRLEDLVQERHERAEREAGRSLPPDHEANAELRGTMRDRVEFNVRAGILLWELEQHVQPEVTPAQIDGEFDRAVASYPEHLHAAARKFYSQASEREALRDQVMQQQLVAYILQHAAPPSAAPEGQVAAAP